MSPLQGSWYERGKLYVGFYPMLFYFAPSGLPLTTDNYGAARRPHLLEALTIIFYLAEEVDGAGDALYILNNRIAATGLLPFLVFLLH